MTTTSSETVTADDFAVITLVTRLHAAAAAGRKLLEAAELDACQISSELDEAIRGAQVAYDRLAEIDTQAAP